MHDELVLQIYEIDEMFRCTSYVMTQLGRAELMAKRRDLYQQLYPNAVEHGGSRYTNKERPLSFGRDVEVTLGISIATVNRMLARVDQIDANVRRWLSGSGSPIADNARELDCLTKFSVGQQRNAVAAVMSGQSKTIREYAEKAGLPI